MMSFSLEEMKDNMISWVLEHLVDEIYARWCLSFVEDAIEQSNGIEVFGGDSAKESFLLYKDAMRIDKPERGTKEI